MFNIGLNREKWTEAQRNARVGDIVLLVEKNTPRLQWPMGTITIVEPDEDELIRRVMVKPFTQANKSARAEAPRERAVTELILLKEVLTTTDHTKEGSAENPELTHTASVLFTTVEFDPNQYGFKPDAAFSYDKIFDD